MVFEIVVVNDIEQASAYTQYRNRVDVEAPAAQRLPGAIRFTGIIGSRKIVADERKKRCSESKNEKKLAYVPR